MDDYDRDTGEIVERAQLPAMHESRPQNLIFASAECGEVFGALCEMQGDMQAPKRTKEAKVQGKTKAGATYEYKYSYAPLDEIIGAIKLPMKTAGLAYRQFLAARGGQHVMRTIIAHRSGQWLGTDYPIFWDESRGMQGFASGVTYARRYGLMLALGIAAEDDDDANVADGRPATVSEKRSGRRTAPEPQSAYTDTPEQLPPVPPPPNAPSEASEKYRAEARRQYAVMHDAIAHAATAGEVDAMLASNDWTALHDLIAEAEGADKAISIMKRLSDRADATRAALHGEGLAHA